MKIELLDIRRSDRKHKKYVADVIIQGKLFLNVHFGDLRFQHYHDITPLKLYSHLDHNDKKRRENYLARHKYDTGAAGILAKQYLEGFAFDSTGDPSLW